MVSPREAAGLRLTAGERVYRAVSAGAFGLVWLLARAAGTPRSELRCRIGAMPKACGPLIWFHGASAGEMAAALRLTMLLQQHGQRFTAAYTAANRAGVELAARAARPGSITTFAPWDHPRWVARALDQWRPQAIFLVETELWPGLIFEAYRRQVPIVCVSARVYARDFPRYRLVRGLTATMLRRLTGILSQNEIERERLLALGAPAERCVAAGNLKYLPMNQPFEVRHARSLQAGIQEGRGVDSRLRTAAMTKGPTSSVGSLAQQIGAPTDQVLGADTVSRGTHSLREALGLRPDDQVIVCGSVHRDEVALLFAALSRQMSSDLHAIIAPRHPSAIATIVREAQRRDWICHLHTGAPPPSWQVLVLGAMGELAEAYAMASLAVVGGGFGKHGGHNPFEPVMLGVPVIFGRHSENFEQETRALTALVPEAQVADASELAARLHQWLGSETRRRQVAALQQQALPNATDIATRYIAALSRWLPGTWA